MRGFDLRLSCPRMVLGSYPSREDLAAARGTVPSLSWKPPRMRRNTRGIPRYPDLYVRILGFFVRMPPMVTILKIISSGFLLCVSLSNPIHAAEMNRNECAEIKAVSYTHLTLPKS